MVPKIPRAILNRKAVVMMAGEEAEVANQGYARRRYQGGETSDEVDWFEQDGTRAIFPRTFEANADAAATS